MSVHLKDQPKNKSTIEIKTYTHFVLKRNDVGEALTIREQKDFVKLIKKVDDYRLKQGKQLNDYYVCNMDEPYAKDVYDTIIIGELRKQNS